MRFLNYVLMAVVACFLGISGARADVQLGAYFSDASSHLVAVKANYFEFKDVTRVSVPLPAGQPLPTDDELNSMPVRYFYMQFNKPGTKPGETSDGNIAFHFEGKVQDFQIQTALNLPLGVRRTFARATIMILHPQLKARQIILSFTSNVEGRDGIGEVQAALEQAKGVLHAITQSGSHDFNLRVSDTGGPDGFSIQTGNQNLASLSWADDVMDGLNPKFQTMSLTDWENLGNKPQPQP